MIQKNNTRPYRSLTGPAGVSCGCEDATGENKTANPSQAIKVEEIMLCWWVTGGEGRGRTRREDLARRGES